MPAVSARLRSAVALAKAPVFLLEAQNDYSLGPIRVLTKEAGKKGKDFKSILHLAARIRTGIGDSAPQPPMFGEATCWRFSKQA